MQRWAFGLMERLCLWPRKCLISWFFLANFGNVFQLMAALRQKNRCLFLQIVDTAFSTRKGVKAVGLCRVVAANGSGCHRRCEVAEFEVLHLR